MPPEKLETPETGNPAPQPQSDPLVTATPELVVPITDGVTEPQVVDTAGEDKVTHQVPQAEFKKLKEKAHEKGRKAALAEFVKQANAAGFETPEDAFAEISELRDRLDELSREPEPEDEDTRQMAQTKKPTKSKRNGQPKRSNSRSKEDRMESKNAKEIERLGREKEREKAKWRREEKRRKSAEHRLLAAQAEMEIREIAINAGIKDVNYAVHLMARECKSLPKDKLGEFDEQKFFTGLRDTQPYLFGETTVPANTGTGAGNEDTPPVPKPGEVLTQTAEDTQFNARTASNEEVQNRLRELGLRSGSMAAG